MQSSFGAHKSEPGRLQVTPRVAPEVREKLREMGYSVETIDRTYSPITAIYFDWVNGTMWGVPATSATTTGSLGKRDLIKI